VIGGAIVAMAAAALGAALLALLLTSLGGGGGCSASATPIVLGPPGTGQTVGASEYGGPGDPSSGTTGAWGDDLQAHPDTYAELGGLTRATATGMGGLSYMTALRITWGRRSAVGYKRDIGLGGGPIAAYPRVIDLWWQLAGSLGIPYEDGRWSGPVTVGRAPASGAGAVLGQQPAAPLLNPPTSAGLDDAACAPGVVTGAPLAPGDRAQLLPDGSAAAPADAPAAVKEMIAAGNQIVGKPYVYGGGHGVPLSSVAGVYDCSSSVEHLLFGGGLVAVDDTATSGSLESFGAPGPGKWVTLYASTAHVFMYVAGLRWDTWGAGGPGDGGLVIGWHPLVRNADGFVARHPVGL
jgi:hypothetical protein